MFSRQIMTDMQARFEVEFAVTSSHRKRQKNDMQIEFSYIHWLMEAPKSTSVTVDADLYKSYIHHDSLGEIGYVIYQIDMPSVSSFFQKNSINGNIQNVKALSRILKGVTGHLKYLCINDLLEHDKSGADDAKMYLKIFYEALYPNKSKLELWSFNNCEINKI